jgi:hypothetical protein
MAGAQIDMQKSGPAHFDPFDFSSMVVEVTCRGETA